MADQVVVSGEEEKLAKTITALQKSADKTIGYFTGSWVFYLILISFFIFLVVMPDEPEVRGANIGILILLGLAFVSLWTSPLRGLKASKVGIGGFLNLFHLSLTDRLNELKDGEKWSSQVHTTLAPTASLRTIER